MKTAFAILNHELWDLNEEIKDPQRSLTHKDVLAKAERIWTSDVCGDKRWQLWDALVFDVINHHPHGMAADVLKIVFAAWDADCSKNDKPRPIVLTLEKGKQAEVDDVERLES